MSHSPERRADDCWLTKVARHTRLSLPVNLPTPVAESYPLLPLSHRYCSIMRRLRKFSIFLEFFKMLSAASKHFQMSRRPSFLPCPRTWDWVIHASSQEPPFPHRFGNCVQNKRHRRVLETPITLYSLPISLRDGRRRQKK